MSEEDNVLLVLLYFFSSALIAGDVNKKYCNDFRQGVLPGTQQGKSPRKISSSVVTQFTNTC